MANNIDLFNIKRQKKKKKKEGCEVTEVKKRKLVECFLIPTKCHEQIITDEYIF